MSKIIEDYLFEAASKPSVVSEDSLDVKKLVEVLEELLFRSLDGETDERDMSDAELAACKVLAAINKEDL